MPPPEKASRSRMQPGRPWMSGPGQLAGRKAHQAGGSVPPASSQARGRRRARQAGPKQSAVRSWVARLSQGHASGVHDGVDAALTYCLHKGAVVALRLARILDGELAHGIIEDLAGAHVACDHGGAPRAGRRPWESPAADRAVGAQIGGVEVLDDGAGLHVAQLADVEVPPAVTQSPAQEKVTGSLHQALAG